MQPYWNDARMLAAGNARGYADGDPMAMPVSPAAPDAVRTRAQLAALADLRDEVREILGPQPRYRGQHRTGLVARAWRRLTYRDNR